jgi:hypothetical protein
MRASYCWEDEASHGDYEEILVKLVPIGQHVRRLHVTYKSNPTVGLRIMIVAVKLHSFIFYIKIRI